MRPTLIFSALALSGFATLALLVADNPDRHSAVLAGQAMGEIRGADPDTVVYPEDICAANGITPNTGTQTAMDCASGPTYPFGPCIDCGTQLQSQFQSEVSSGKTNRGTLPCDGIVMKTGSCNRDANGDYYCAGEKADANSTTCSGNYQRLNPQSN